MTKNVGFYAATNTATILNAWYIESTFDSDAATEGNGLISLTNATSSAKLGSFWGSLLPAERPYATSTQFLLNQNVSLYSTASEKKVSVIERFNRTLKEWMYKEFTKTNSSDYRY